MPSLPFNDLRFIEFGITYMMLAPSRLRLSVLGKNLEVDEATIDADFETRIRAALTDAGFHGVDQIYTHFEPYFRFLTRNSRRDLLRQVNQMMTDSGEYSDDPPHPDDGHGQALLSAIEGLAGRALPA